MKILSTLSKNQRDAVGLLQIGTFLEYFDLMLYVHLAVLLNELFFPKTSPHTAALLSAFAFCSTYLLRPFGALFFGYIGDNIGRKAAIVLSTSMMAIACFFMSILPTYEEIGIFASVAMISCRILQGFSATGEVIGAEIYLSELLKPPASYQLVSWVVELCTLGSFAALFASSLIFKCNASWRTVFILGGMIALSGAVARRKLRETPDFLKSQLLKHKIEIKKPSTSKRTSAAYFMIYSGYPLCFYITYIYCSDILKHSFNYKPEQVIDHNLLITLLSFLIGVSIILMAKYIDPLKIVKIRGYLSTATLLSIPFLPLCNNLYALIAMQVLLSFFALGTVPAIPIFFKYFPVHKRFTYSSMLYAVSRALMYVCTSFGLVYLTELLGIYGLWLIVLPVCAGFLWGTRHFEKLEKVQVEERLPVALAA